MKRMNWLTAGVRTEKMVVTTVADCCSTLSAGWPPPLPMTLSDFCSSSSSASGCVIVCSFCLTSAPTSVARPSQ